MKNHQLGWWMFIFVRIRELEQHGPAFGGANNSPVGCYFVRGSQPTGTSAGRNATGMLNPNLFSIEEGFGFFVLENQVRKAQEHLRMFLRSLIPVPST